MVIVIDGPIGRELSEIIDGFEQDESIHIIRLPKNNGLGNALRIAVEYAKYDLIARMDSDDIALPDRFESSSDVSRKIRNCLLLVAVLQNL